MKMGTLLNVSTKQMMGALKNRLVDMEVEGESIRVRIMDSNEDHTTVKVVSSDMLD